MGGEVCRGCDFGVRKDGEGVWCNLGNDFARKFGDFCPRENDMETIRQNCVNYILVEKMADRKSCCAAHLAVREGRAYQRRECWIENIEDLRRDFDFKFKPNK